METIVRKLGTTIYGLVGYDWTRMTLARVDGIVMFVRADGSNAPVPELPATYRTSGDMMNVISTLGHRVNAASVPSVALPAHAWKSTYTLAELAEHKYQGPALKGVMAELLATYADSNAAIAA